MYKHFMSYLMYRINFSEIMKVASTQIINTLSQDLIYRYWGCSLRYVYVCIYTKFELSIFTTRVRSTTGGYIFTLSTICGGGGVPHLADRGYPLPRSGWEGYPIQLTGGTHFPGLDGGYPIQLMGVPLPRSGWGVPHPADGGATPPAGGTPWQGLPTYQSSIVCTCYAAGGVPLAFT